mmetsp:Transcript_22047/g.35478  ORF Transcript_22047/g.35478 Transcript_22047/m.35478 type:complete len:622 (-) Transcript_22047:262-2127(-)
MTCKLLGISIVAFFLLPVLEGFSSSPRRPPRVRPFKPSSSRSSPQKKRGDGTDRDDDRDMVKRQKGRHEQALQDPTLLTQIDFRDREDIHPSTQRALTEGLGLKSMTKVQAETYFIALEGRSIMARSRTGSGKTLAFLLPSLERLLEGDLDLYKPGHSIGMIVLAPTRELAIQISDQAEILLNYHAKSKAVLNVACLYGGVKMQRDMRVLSGAGGPASRLPTILVSTPGRLLEHLEGNTRIGRRKFAEIVEQTKIVVCDETDRLFESHKHETQKILSFLARSEKRQTLFFSATFPRSIRRFLTESILKNVDVVEVDCIQNDKTSEKITTSRKSRTPVTINQRIKQSYVILDDMSQYIPMLLTILRREQEINKDNFKILVFFPASRLVRFFYQYFTIGGIRLESEGNDGNQSVIWEIHSRMSQSSRSRASNNFRNAKKGILFSSDVSARGLDYPDVTLVVQMGAPANAQDYIHRIGRTGRAGQTGRALMVLLPFERRASPNEGSRSAMHQDTELTEWVRGDDINELNGDVSSTTLFQKCKSDLEATRMKVRSGHTVLTPSAEAAFKAFVAHYISTAGSARAKNNSKLRPSEVLTYADDFSKAAGLANPPELDATIASRMGLK